MLLTVNQAYIRSSRILAANKIIMKPLYTEEQFRDVKSRQKMPLECEVCFSVFYKKKHHLQCEGRHSFCSRECQYKAQETFVEKECAWCDKKVKRLLNQAKKSKTGNIFCNESCAASYNNRNKSTGTRSSKLEQWIAKELPKVFPNEKIIFNGKEAIGSELDIYFPERKIGVEINGIFHYEPIYGEEKLKKIQQNDKEKREKCRQRQIDLIEVDTRDQKYFTQKTSKKFLDKIVKEVKNVPR